jgi:YggT family protein
MQALLFILNALITLVVVAFLLRLLMPLVRADFRNPIGQAVLTLTNPVVMPLRKALPPSKRFDVAALVALILVQLVGTALLRLVAGGTLTPAGVIFGGLRDLVHTVLQFYFIAVLLYALLSWFASDSYNPAHQILSRISEPLLAPVRRVIPPLGGLDLSALFVLIALQALQILLR